MKCYSSIFSRCTCAPQLFSGAKWQKKIIRLCHGISTKVGQTRFLLIVTPIGVLAFITGGELRAQCFKWAKAIGSTDTEEGRSVVVNSSGNVYTTGYFKGTADFDPGAGTFYLTSAGGNDIFVSKLDASGNFIWAKSMGGRGSSGDNGSAIAVDGIGNVYTTGFFVGTADFDPGTKTFNLTSAGGYDIFISKLDAFGNFIWAKGMGGISNGYESGSSIAVDGIGNVYTTGYFNGTADFDPGPGTYNLTSAGGNDIFISKLDAFGNFIWVKSISSADYGYGNSIVVDGIGNVYTTGHFNGTTDFDPGTGTFNLTSAGSWDIFVCKLDTSGNFIWAKSIGDAGSDYGSSIAVDGIGNVCTTGFFQGTADFDPGSEIFNLTSAGDYDIFISKLDSSGNLIWAKSIGGTGSDNGHTIAVDGIGNVYTAGFFDRTTDFDPGAGTFNLTSAGGFDIYVNKLDASGNFIWAKSMGGTSIDNGYSIAVDSRGNIYITGSFAGTADFDPGSATFSLSSSAGSKDIFICKLGTTKPGFFKWLKKFFGKLHKH